MNKEEVTGLKVIQDRIAYKYSILENIRKELKIKARYLYNVEEDIKKLEDIKNEYIQKTRSYTNNNTQN